MVARNGNGVKLWHVPAGVAHDIGNDALHAGLGRINVRVADQKLFENVVLNGAAELLQDGGWVGRTCTLLLLLERRLNVKGQHGEHGAVHGHAHRHLRQINAVKQHLHVFQGINGHPRQAHVARAPVVVAVVAAVRGQIKGHGEALLTRL